MHRVRLPAGLELVGLHARRGGAEVLRGIDLTVARDELLVVLGPSGAGKSTLLRVIAGLEPTSAGRVVIAGRDVTRLRPGRRGVSMVFQSYALFPHLTVAANIGFPLLVTDTPPAQARDRVRRAAEAAGCAELLDRRPGQLSGGEQQRVALARALVRAPDLYLLDEPLSNLDLELRVQTRGELKALHATVGGTMVHVTHDQTEALVLGDRIAVLREGRIEQVGTPDEIWHQPANTFVARFVGSPPMNLLPADGPLRPVGGPDTVPGQLGFRPDVVRLGDPEGAQGQGAQGQGAEGIVERVDVVGSEAYVYLRVAGHVVVARVSATDRPARGAMVRATVHWADIHVFDAAGRRRPPP